VGGGASCLLVWGWLVEGGSVVSLLVLVVWGEWAHRHVLRVAAQPKHITVMHTMHNMIYSVSLVPTLALLPSPICCRGAFELGWDVSASDLGESGLPLGVRCSG
jgi:heme exporter protein D